MEYSGIIEEIKDDVVICKLQDNLDHITYLELSKNQVDVDNLKLGKTFDLYTVIEPEQVMGEVYNSNVYRIDW